MMVLILDVSSDATQFSEDESSYVMRWICHPKTNQPPHWRIGYFHWGYKQIPSKLKASRYSLHVSIRQMADQQMRERFLCHLGGRLNKYTNSLWRWWTLNRRTFHIIMWKDCTHRQPWVTSIHEGFQTRPPMQIWGNLGNGPVDYTVKNEGFALLFDDNDGAHPLHAWTTLMSTASWIYHWAWE